MAEVVVVVVRLREYDRMRSLEEEIFVVSLLYVEWHSFWDFYWLKG